MIAEMLGTGRQNAMTARYLCDLLGLTPRELTLAIESERRKGEPICASTGEPCGYFLAADREEMEHYCRSLWKRAGEIHKTRRACLKTIESLPEEDKAEDQSSFVQHC